MSTGFNSLMASAPKPSAISLAIASALLAGFAINPAFAQTRAPGSQTDQRQLEDVTIESSPFRESLSNQVSPSLILQRNELQSRMDANLGTLLENEVGITTSGHGPNSGRPIIRGLSNDRVKILNNGISVFDASTSSEDHAVAINPIFADRIEVLRGAATLRYGGNAIGGAVNVIDDRTPVNLPVGQHAEARFSGRLGSAQDTAAGHFALGRDNFALSVDAFDIRTGDVKVPGEFFSARGLAEFREESGDPQAANPRGRLPNSSARTDGGSVGGAIRGSWGYAGISTQQLNNNYGIGNAASDESPRIDLRQDRNEFKGRLNLSGLFESLNVDATNSRYRHSELVAEDGAVKPEVTFRNEGDEIRLEGLTRALGSIRASAGYQRSTSRFRAFNDEGTNSFLPNTRTSGDALYLTGLTQAGALQLNAGIRHEDHQVRGDASNPCAQSADRRFNLNSGSLGARLALNTEQAVSLQFNRSERAPTAVELFACGKHEATFNAQYGNVNLPKEKANGIDLAWSFKDNRWNTRASVYRQDFDNFITLRASDRTDLRNNESEENPGTPAVSRIVDYSATRATLTGAEFTTQRTLAGSTLGLNDAWTPVVELRIDTTRGVDENLDQPLARITPRRITLGGVLNHQRGYVRIQVVNHAAQNRISAADEETRTDGYNRVDAFVSYRPQWNLGTARTELFLQGRNLTDARGRNHVSFLKDFIPVQGRTVTAGVRFLF